MTPPRLHFLAGHEPGESRPCGASVSGGRHAPLLHAFIEAFRDSSAVASRATLTRGHPMRQFSSALVKRREASADGDCPQISIDSSLGCRCGRFAAHPGAGRRTGSTRSGRSIFGPETRALCHRYRAQHGYPRIRTCARVWRR